MTDDDAWRKAEAQAAVEDALTGVARIDCLKLLREYGLWPMDGWNRFEVVHQTSYDPDEEAHRLALILGNVGAAAGVYAYLNGEGAWLYVGKGARLFDRFKAHYQCASRALPGEHKGKKWHRFWSARPGRLTVYWIAVEGEADRRIFEVALTAILQPAFAQFR